jgi:hypothetical protein
LRINAIVLSLVLGRKVHFLFYLCSSKFQERFMVEEGMRAWWVFLTYFLIYFVFFFSFFFHIIRRCEGAYFSHLCFLPIFFQPYTRRVQEGEEKSNKLYYNFCVISHHACKSILFPCFRNYHKLCLHRTIVNNVNLLIWNIIVNSMFLGLLYKFFISIEIL